MRPRQWHDRIPAALRRTGRRQVAVLAPQQEAATVVIGPEEMDCEHLVDCTGGSLAASASQLTKVAARSLEWLNRCPSCHRDVQRLDEAGGAPLSSVAWECRAHRR
jgi:hypothetical protein